MADMVFVLFIAAPLVLLGINLGRGAVGLTRATRASQPGAIRPRRTRMDWPARPRRAVPALDQGRSLSPLAAFGRWRQRPGRTTSVDPAPATVLPPEKTAPAATPAPIAVPVTASPTGFRRAPASAFTAGPALTPRRERERATVADPA